MSVQTAPVPPFRGLPYRNSVPEFCPMCETDTIGDVYGTVTYAEWVCQDCNESMVDYILLTN